MRSTLSASPLLALPILLPLGLTAASLPPPHSTAHPDHPAPAPPAPPLAMPAGSRHLFVDDALIERFSGGVGIRQGSPLRVTTDKPVLVADAPWEQGCLIYWFSSALRAHDDPDELRYYYVNSDAFSICRAVRLANPKSAMQYLLCPRHGWATGVPVANCSAHTACGLNDTAWDTFLSLAVSRTDGDTWEKPALHQVDWRNSTANNIVIRGPRDGTRKIVMLSRLFCCPLLKRKRKRILQRWRAVMCGSTRWRRQPSGTATRPSV